MPQRHFDRLVLAVAALSIAWVALAWSAGDRLHGLNPAFVTYANLAQVVLAAVGAWYAFRIVRQLEAGNPARRGWLLVAAGFGAFAIGEALDAYYEVVLTTNRPFPSWADALFLLAYASVAVGLMVFVWGYGRSDLGGGELRRHLVPTTVFTVALAPGLFLLLRDLAGGSGPALERWVSASYPALDLLVLVPAFALTRITRAFRGGRVWSVWASILAGFALTCVADLIFGYLTVRGIAAQDVLMELLYLLSYLAFARGAFLQHGLVA
jgi:hypothetical protein